MARDPARTPVLAAWAKRAGLLMVANQRLLVFPIAIAIGQALAFAPLVAVTRSSLTLDVFGQDIADPVRRVRDLLDASPDGSVLAAITLALAAGILLQAWLSASFIRSLVSGQVVLVPGLRPFTRLAALYATSTIAGYAIAGLPGLALALLPVQFLLFGYADYIAILEGRPPWQAVRRSVEIAARQWQASFLIFFASLVAAGLVYSLFSVPLHDGDSVFAPFLLAFLLTEALVQYASDCALIAVVLGERPEATDEPRQART